MSLPLLADFVCPALGLAVILAPALPGRPFRTGDLWARTAAATAGVYALAGLDRWFSWWSSAGLDFSTHTGVAIALATGLAVSTRRARVPVGAVLLGYAVLIVHLGYHSVADTLTTAAATAPATLAAFSAFARPSGQTPPDAGGTGGAKRPARNRE